MVSESADHGAIDCPAVAVVTRTKDRPILLARAGRSVAAQTFRDLVWVVVNDGGDETAARSAIAASGMEPARVLFVSHAASQGMEAAANAGARASRSRYIAVHDDDDTWHPEFLARLSGHLGSAHGRHYGGAVCHADYVSEEISGNAVIEHQRRPYNGDLKSVHLAEMLVRNMFPPISFLFRRDIWEQAGGFNERLPVLGDWYFNIRFLLAADIAVVPERLAGWHHRERGAAAAYSNSVIGGIGLHEEYNAVVRNALVRDLGAQGAALAPLLGYAMEQQRLENARLRRSVGSGSASTVTASEGDPASLLAAVTDIADRRWVLAQLPLRSRLRLGRRSDPSWAALMPLLKGACLRASADFDEAAYRAAHLDVEQGIAAGRIASGFDHYIRYGRLEGRARPLKLS